MKVKTALRKVLAIVLMLFTSFSVLSNGARLVGATDLGSHVVYSRVLTFYETMKPRLENYAKTQNWLWKVHPFDILYLETLDLNSVVNVDVYVLNPKEATVYSRDLREPEKIQTTFYVYQPTEEQADRLSQIPHVSIYRSKFRPAICMRLEKRYLPEIASIPYVYCIRAAPDMKTMAVSIERAREVNDLIYVKNNHRSRVATMYIAIIDTGYDPNDSLLNGEANDNIAYRYDFTDNDHDVSNGDNWHGTTCLDLLARGFGDVGDDDSMYDQRNIYCVLKVGEGESINFQLAGQAIEFCLQNNIDVVIMSFGEPPWWWIFPESKCNGYWCELFKQGTDANKCWVAAAGNDDAHHGVCYPAESHFVIAVGAYESTTPQGEAERWYDGWGVGSNYGWTKYAEIIGGELYVYCWYCFTGYDLQEFKPNVYDAGEINELLPRVGTSFAAPLAAASIALGYYSNPISRSFPELHSVVAMCCEWPVIPAECSYQGDVIDTHTLWHRQAVPD